MPEAPPRRHCRNIQKQPLKKIMIIYNKNYAKGIDKENCMWYGIGVKGKAGFLPDQTRKGKKKRDKKKGENKHEVHKD